MAVNIVTGMTGTAHITSDDDRCFNASIIGKGEYVFDYGKKFSADIINNNLIRIHDGMCITQGTQMGIELNDYEDVIIENGQSGSNRNDLIVIRYERNADTSIEKASLVVIKGESVDNTEQTQPIYPQPTSGNILDGGDLVVDIPLYYVTIQSLTITNVTQLFNVLNNAEWRRIIGLENVDNTKDSAKEVKSATRLANTKAIGGPKKPVYFNSQGIPVEVNYLLGDACAKGVSTSIIANDTNLVTGGAVSSAIGKVASITTGSWTPNFYRDATHAIGTNMATGMYYKIGKLVYITGYVALQESSPCYSIKGIPLEVKASVSIPLNNLLSVYISKFDSNVLNVGSAALTEIRNKGYNTSDKDTTWIIEGWYITD